MTALIADPELAKRLIAERQALGQDKYDEVWDGVYVMSPMPNPEHEDIVAELIAIFVGLIKRRGLGTVHAGGNVSGNDTNWTSNYRNPDVIVYLKTNRAERREAYWYGGPDLAVEVISEGDRTYEKLPYYAKISTRQVLIIDRDPWAIILYVNQDGEMVEVARSTAENHLRVVTEAVPVSLEMATDESGRPQIEVRHLTEPAHWTIKPGA
jgi:Uma2 family endonuclease